MRRRATALLLAISTLQACSGSATHLVESDVPVPTGMNVRYSVDLKRADGRLAGGWFILWGEILHIEPITKETITRYQADGWALVEQRMLPKQADLRFAKDVRTVHVIIDARRVDPWSSSATVRVATSTDAARVPSEESSLGPSPGSSDIPSPAATQG